MNEPTLIDPHGELLKLKRDAVGAFLKRSRVAMPPDITEADLDRIVRLAAQPARKPDL